MLNELNAKSYCKEDISKIENYDKAKADNQIWVCHHRRESIYTKQGLIEISEYFHRPAAELIFLSRIDHTKLHMKGRVLTKRQRERISKSLKGNKLTARTKKAISIALKGKNKGKKHSDSTKQKISKSLTGKKMLSKTKEAIHKAITGCHWWTNGIENKFSRKCPQKGFKRGRVINAR